MTGDMTRFPIGDMTRFPDLVGARTEISFAYPAAKRDRVPDAPPALCPIGIVSPICPKRDRVPN